MCGLQKWCKRTAKARRVLCRYADDFVCAFQFKRDAERFYGVLGKRLGKYGLELAPEKTRLLGFSRYRKDAKSRFDFLGLTFLLGHGPHGHRSGSSVGPHGRG